MGRIDRGALALGRRLGEGARGAVYAVTGRGIDHGWSLAYKEYNPGALPQVQVGALIAMADLIPRLSPPTSEWLRDKTAWPTEIVESEGQVTGFLMRAVPDRFELDLDTASGAVRGPATLDLLLGDDTRLARLGMHLTERDRLLLLTDLAATLSRLHSMNIAVGDLSPKNVLFSTAPPPECFLIGCDAMSLNDMDILLQVETPGWRLPDGEPNGTRHGDAYLFALLAVRLFARNQTSTDPAALTAVNTTLGDLARQALNADLGHRPTPAQWTNPLLAATRPAPTPPATTVVEAAKTTAGAAPPTASPTPPPPAGDTTTTDAEAATPTTYPVLAPPPIVPTTDTATASPTPPPPAGDTTTTDAEAATPATYPVLAPPPIVPTTTAPGADTATASPAPSPLAGYTTIAAGAGAAASAAGPVPSPLLGGWPPDPAGDQAGRDRAIMAGAAGLSLVLLVVFVVVMLTGGHHAGTSASRSLVTASPSSTGTPTPNPPSSAPPDLFQQAQIGDCYTNYGTEQVPHLSKYICEHGYFQLAKILTSTTDLHGCDSITTNVFAVASYADNMVLCLGMDYPDAMGTATVNECLEESGPDGHNIFTVADSCSDANVVVTGRTPNFKDEAFCGGDGSAWWQSDTTPNVSYTVCYRRR